MTRIELAPEIFDDLDRIFDHLAAHGAEEIPQRIAEITGALQVLEHSPLIGRKVHTGKRELVIGRGSRGYLALYRYVNVIDTVFVLAIRSQRELGYRAGD